MTPRQEAREQAERRLKHGQPRPERAPKKLRLGAIKEAPEVFQFRKPLEYASEAHAHDLARTVKSGTPLEALFIWWGGDGWYCIDGHHRLMAYRLGRWPLSKEIPVVEYQGPVVAAMLRSGANNMRPKLGVSKPEQSQAAWEQVCTFRPEEATASQIAASACVSIRQVKYMRGVFRALNSKDPSRDLSGVRWCAARMEHGGLLADDDVEIDYEEHDRLEGEQLARILSKALGDRGHQRPRALAYALELYSAPLVPFLLEHWRDQGISRETDGEDDEF